MPTPPRHLITLPLIVLAIAAGLALVWYSAPSLLLLFAGILFAALLDACTRGLGYVLPLSRPTRHALVVVLFASVAAVALGLSIVRLPGQAHALLAVMDAQLAVLERELATFGIDLFGPGGRESLSQFLTDDLAARDAVELFVRRVGLSPTILSERPNRGSTVIEKIEREGVCAFAVVLLTPDDRGGPKDSDPSSYRERARQNVLLELGYFIGKIGRNRVCALYKGNVEIPSDYSGVVWVRFDDAGAWKKELGKEFLAAKLPADLTTG